MSKRTMLIIGRKCSKGWVELPGAIHLGHGVWIMRVCKIEAEKLAKGVKK